MGNPCARNGDLLDLVSRLGVKNMQIGIKALQLDAVIHIIIGLLRRQGMMIIEGPRIRGGNAETFAISGNMTERRHPAMRQFCQRALPATAIHDTYFATLNIVGKSPLRIEAYTCFAETPVGRAVKVDIGFEYAFLVASQLPLFPRREIEEEEIGILAFIGEKNESSPACQ